MSALFHNTILTLAFFFQPVPEPLHGHREELSIAGRSAFLISPDKAAGQGWLWYAPTLAQYPNAKANWIFNRVLDAGFAVAGINVGESFGNQEGRAAFDELYRYMTEERKLGKPCLLGQSRGALMLFNWAADHPERAACIAGIYPVLDMESWPGLSNQGLASAYGGADPQHLREMFAEINPIQRAAPLASAHIPMFLIHGTSDKLVPAERNSIPYARRYQELGGELQLILVPDKGHAEIPEFFESRPLADFLLRHLR